MEKIAIILTTFLRDELMIKTVQSIIDNWQDNYVLLIGDQGKHNQEKTIKIENQMGDKLKTLDNLNKNLIYYQLPYDIGLSAARNYLVQKASELNCEYCVISADSIRFTDKYNFSPIIEYLNSNPKNAIIGFNLKNRQPWVYDLEIHPKYNKFVVIKPRRRVISSDNIQYTPCDTVANFFIGKTAILMNSYDPILKMAEHEDFFIRLKRAGYKTFYTDQIEAEYINEKPDEYKQMRNRLYGEFKNILKKKYNFDPMGSWLCYNEKLPKEDRI